MYVVAAVDVVMAMSAPVGHTQVPVPVCSWKYRAISMHNACRLLQRQGHTVRHRNVSKASHVTCSDRSSWGQGEVHCQ